MTPAPKPEKVGFSLLEVMVALAILAIMFTAVSGAMAGDAFLQQQAPIYTRAALIAKGAVLDIEQYYNSQDEFPEDEVTGEDCPEDVFDKEYSCDYDLEPMDIEQEQLNEMVGNLMEQLMGGEDGGNILAMLGPFAMFMPGSPVSGLPVHPAFCPISFSQMGQVCGLQLEVLGQRVMMVASFLPIMIVAAAKRVRKLRLRVYRKGEKEPVLQISTFIVHLPKETLQEQVIRKTVEKAVSP